MATNPPSPAAAPSPGISPSQAHPLATSLPATGTDTAAPFDRQFIDMMVPHHQGALEMARIAQARAQHQEIKELAADILRSQAAEIDRMKAWRRAWFGSDETPPMSAMPMLPGMDQDTMGGMHAAKDTMDMQADVDALRAAPEPFDRAFVDAMIPHHQSGVDAATLAQAKAERPEIKDLAKAIIAAQEREIGQMRQWRTAWYGAE